MTPSRVPLALVLVMVAVLLAAGCSGQQAGEWEGTGNGSAPAATTSTVPPLTPPDCPRPISLERSNYSQWITLNPGSDHFAGETFSINGTIQRKNQSEDFEKIYIIIERFGPHTGKGPQIVFEGVADHFSGNCAVKSWSISVNLSENLASGIYDVMVDTSKQSLSYSFNLSQPRPSGSQIQEVTNFSDPTSSGPVTPL